MTLSPRRIFLALLTGLALAGATHGAFAADQAPPQVSIKTSLGEIVVELNPEKAPKSVANFLQYVKERHYKNTVFHRVIDGFMIQGGGFDKNMKEKKTHAPIESESKNGLTNDKYTLAMARQSDPHSATSQFYINVENNGALDFPGADGWGYTVFGKVVKGTDVVDKIKQVAVTDKGMFQNVPTVPVVIKSVTLVK